ncbi:MAG: CRISPR-associated endonuclease Cas1 [Gammaproteobacteria bacterium]
MSTLYLDRKDLAVKLDSHALALYENGEKRGTVPFKLLARVVVRGNVQFESRLLCALSEHHIDVMFLAGRSNRRQAMSFNHSHNDIRRRLAQYRSYFVPAHQIALARTLIQAKLKNQHTLLADALVQRPDCRKPLYSAVQSLTTILEKLNSLSADALTIDQLRGFEGGAAAVYFGAFTKLFPPGLGFDKRVKRPPTDPVNACLSLGYTLLHFEGVTVCHSVGLEPLLGFYHEPAFGRESMACDLIEPVRPRLDRLVWGLFRERRLQKEHFVMDKGSCLLNKDGRKIFYANYEAFAQPVRRLLRRSGHWLAKDYLARDWNTPL